MGKYGGLGPPSVDRGRHWSMVDLGWGLGGGSSELGLAATPEYGSSLAGAQQREGNTGILARASPRLKWWWRGGTMEAMNGGSLILV
jgi:hypothetical protein